MIPSREEAELILREAENCNPGPWGNHSRVAAHCAKEIAARCEGMDPDKAYILGLLHDIGRKFGTRHLGHVADGYTYMMSLGYDEAARVCLTHSFHDQTKAIERQVWVKEYQNTSFSASVKESRKKSKEAKENKD